MPARISKRGELKRRGGVGSGGGVGGRRACSAAANLGNGGFEEDEGGREIGKGPQREREAA
jgi:hypothetical protein